LPGSLSFIATLQTWTFCLQQWGWLGLVFTVSTLITASYILRTVGGLFADNRSSETLPIPDLTFSERLAATLLMGLLFGLGLWPAPWLTLSSHTLEKMQDSINLSIHTP